MRHATKFIGTRPRRRPHAGEKHSLQLLQLSSSLAYAKPFQSLHLPTADLGHQAGTSIDLLIHLCSAFDGVASKPACRGQSHQGLPGHPHHWPQRQLSPATQSPPVRSLALGSRHNAKSELGDPRPKRPRPGPTARLERSRAPEPRESGSRHMRVTVPVADQDGKETGPPCCRCDDAGTHHEAVRGLPHGAAPLKGPEARAAP